MSLLNNPQPISLHPPITRLIRRRIRFASKTTNLSRTIRSHRGIHSLGVLWIALLAKSGQPTQATPEATADSNIDPAAIDAVKKMGAYLRSFKAFQVTETSPTMMSSRMDRSFKTTARSICSPPSPTACASRSPAMTSTGSISTTEKTSPSGEARQLLRNRSRTANHRRTL